MNIVSPEAVILPNPTTGEPFDAEAAKNLMRHIERCGRTCYKSEDKISDDSAERFIANLVRRGHESVLEHFALTVRFTCDRGVTHEIVRHRIASYSQESTRYCNYKQGKFGSEVTYIDLKGGMALDPTMKSLSAGQVSAIYDEWMLACEDAENHYFRMLDLGASPQMARSVLNNSTKADIVATMNLREWRHFFRLRCDMASHPQMRQVALMLFRQMYELMPPLFEDIHEQLAEYL